MFIDHPHIPQALKLNKRPAVVSQQSPFIVITYRKFSLLTRTIQAVLDRHGYAYQIQEAESQELMGRTLPFLCFQDVVLEKQALVEFLSEICLHECGILQFMDRKENMKKLYRQWWKILSAQFNFTPAFADYQDLRRNDHINQIFEQMINFSTQIIGKGYERSFRSYKSDRFNIQSVFLVDVTETILEQLPRLQSDYVLRGYFYKQIDFSNQYKQFMEREVRDDEVFRKVVLIDGPHPPAKEFPHVNYNLKWFGGIFAAMTVAFLKWGK